MTVNNLESGFENDRISDSGPIDFAAARRLDRSGSTCDVFVTRYQRRRVFIKRLKQEYRTNTVYLAALDKEFDLGVNLHHPSLPEYRAFHGDYIVMDYIDGVTLADILRHVPGTAEANLWLKKPANLKRVLRQLIDVVAYLHRHNIVHSDIKADNIILADDTYNVMLIDFDKAYTPWLDDTRGAGSLYGVSDNQNSSTDIDFHGIGLLIDKLTTAGYPTARFKKLRDKCFTSGVNADQLLSLIDKKLRPTHIIIGISAILLILFGVITYLVTNPGQSDHPATDTDIRQEADTTTATTPAATPADSLLKSETLSVPVSTDTTASPRTKRPKIDYERLIADALHPMYEEYERLVLMAADSTIDNDILYDSLLSACQRDNLYLSKAYRAVNEARHNEDFTLGMKEVWESKPYCAYRRYGDSIQRKVGLIWQSRVKHRFHHQ